jgi:hypothetical protein
MRLNRGVCTFAAVASIAAAAAPAAFANDIDQGGGDPVATAPQVVAAHRDASSADWALIAGGAVLVVGAGVGGSRVLSRRRTSPSEVGTAGLSCPPVPLGDLVGRGGHSGLETDRQGALGVQSGGGSSADAR